MMFCSLKHLRNLPAMTIEAVRKDLSDISGNIHYFNHVASAVIQFTLRFFLCQHRHSSTVISTLPSLKSRD